jgi:hypothetical protein
VKKKPAVASELTQALEKNLSSRAKKENNFPIK